MMVYDLAGRDVDGARVCLQGREGEAGAGCATCATARTCPASVAGSSGRARATRTATPRRSLQPRK
eukprot:3950030-Pleurochrysis_carterae.AAC.1